MSLVKITEQNRSDKFFDYETGVKVVLKYQSYFRVFNETELKKNCVYQMNLLKLSKSRSIFEETNKNEK